MRLCSGCALNYAQLVYRHSTKKIEQIQNKRFRKSHPAAGRPAVYLSTTVVLRSKCVMLINIIVSFGSKDRSFDFGQDNLSTLIIDNVREVHTK